MTKPLRETSTGEVLAFLLVAGMYFAVAGLLTYYYFQAPWVWYHPLTLAILFMLTTGGFCCIEAWKHRPAQWPHDCRMVRLPEPSDIE